VAAALVVRRLGFGQVLLSGAMIHSPGVAAVNVTDVPSVGISGAWRIQRIRTPVVRAGSTSQQKEIWVTVPANARKQPRSSRGTSGAGSPGVPRTGLYTLAWQTMRTILGTHELPDQCLRLSTTAPAARVFGRRGLV